MCNFKYLHEIGKYSYHNRYHLVYITDAAPIEPNLPHVQYWTFVDIQVVLSLLPSCCTCTFINYFPFYSMPNNNFTSHCVYNVKKDMLRIRCYGYDRFWTVYESVGAFAVACTFTSCNIVNFVPIIVLHGHTPKSWWCQIAAARAMCNDNVLVPLKCQFYRTIDGYDKKAVHLASHSA